MSEQEVQTIIEFSEDIATAEQPDPLPARDYPAEVKAVEIKESAKGNKYFSVQFYISPENYPADYPLENNPDGRVITFNRLMAEDAPRARYQLRKFLETLGIPASKRIDVNEWLGQQVQVTIAHREWQGETREEIAAVKAAA